ncbi:unnamed protein product [marine sediment metagenome]|uniref:Uncharacterized protein n=1 Tax=marine sediment metagenome TaxID=412755 RepID=X1D8H9_9ZZZZ
MNSSRGRKEGKKNRVHCKICDVEMNKGQYIQHLDVNGGNCPGNRQLSFGKDAKHILKKIRR